MYHAQHLIPGAILDVIFDVILDVILDVVHHASKLDSDILGMHKRHMSVTRMRQSIVTAVIPHAAKLVIASLGCKSPLDSTCGRTASPMHNGSMNVIHSPARSPTLRTRCNYRSTGSLVLQVKHGATPGGWPAQLMQRRAASCTALPPSPHEANSSATN